MVIDFTPHALLFTIAAIGISETAYLIRKRIAAERPVCPMGEGCVTVLNSKYNRLFFGFHNEIGGLLFYMAFAAITALLVVGVRPETERFLFLALQVMLAGATLLSLALLYLQWKVIRAWCFWCILSAATVGAMGLIIVISELV